MNGVINVFKMPKWTSFDVVAKLRGITGVKQIGHLGTLDPMATGVLPVFIGDATKAINLQSNSDKEYFVSFLCGIKTDTGDIYGNIIEKKHVPANFTIENLKAVTNNFLGEQTQVPPMYSAVKINGTPLYKLARQGKEIERKERNFTVYDIKIQSEQAGRDEFSMTVSCSKGTYIRTLVEDIAAAMGTIATTTALTRTKAGVFTVKNALTIEQLQNAKQSGTLSEKLISTEYVFTDLPIFNADETQLNLLRNGVKLKTNLTDGLYRIYDKAENKSAQSTATGNLNYAAFRGVCEVKACELRIKKFFNKR